MYACMKGKKPLSFQTAQASRVGCQARRGIRRLRAPSESRPRNRNTGKVQENPLVGVHYAAMLRTGEDTVATRLTVYRQAVVWLIIGGYGALMVWLAVS
jgi:hypothetical protein